MPKTARPRPLRPSSAALALILAACAPAPDPSAPAPSGPAGTGGSAVAVPPDTGPPPGLEGPSAPDAAIDFGALASIETAAATAEGASDVPTADQVQGAPAQAGGTVAPAVDFAELARVEAAAARDPVPEDARFGPIETRLLDRDLVSFLVEMEGARDAADVEGYARCAAAQYAVIRGYGFARHVRTTVQQRGGVWRGDAVYTISATLPRGLRTIDAAVTLADCQARGIPTV